MRRILLPALLCLAGCAASPVTVQRDAILMDSGLPLSDAMQSYDVLHYFLTTNVLVEEKAIEAESTIRFEVIRPMDTLDLHFDGQFRIRRISMDGSNLEYASSPHTLSIALGETLDPGTIREVTIAYAGQPVEAKRPPWDGGFVWETSPSGKPWLATAFQGEGCDVWWPCKDHPSGEPRNGMDLVFTVPEGTTVASNGVLISSEPTGDGRTRTHWRTESMINTYGVSFNAGPYVLLETRYTSTNGTDVPVMFWALEEREEQARELFDNEFIPIIQWFEDRVGPYPWGHEKLGVVETPHLGMEHQTINAYGNLYRKDNYGFDWLFHHELAHEWFGNVMTHTTVSDMWLHEGYGAYVQALYTLDTLGDAAYFARMFGSLSQIRGCVPFAPREETSDDQLYFANNGGPGPDIYAKGSWMLHTLRNFIGDEAFWEATRILVYDTPDPASLAPPIQARFRDTDDFTRIISDVAGTDLSWFVEAYARRGPLPEITAEQDGTRLVLTWKAADDLPFNMPIDVRINGKLRRLEFTDNTAVLEGTLKEDVIIDPGLDVLRRVPSTKPCEENDEQ